MGIYNELIFVISYLADITTEDTRTTRMSVLSGASLLAWLIGGLTSKYILEYGGHLGVFSTTLSSYFIAILCIIVFVRDSRGKGSKLEPAVETSKTNEANDSVLSNLWQSFSITFKPRTGYKRACLAILLGMRCISIFSDDPFGMNYLYSRKKFGWDAPDYALFRTAICSSLAFGNLFFTRLN